MHPIVQGTPRDTECPTCKRKFRGVVGMNMHRIAKEH